MNYVAAEISELLHIGVKYRSGRYPYGSGEHPYQHSGDFLAFLSECKKNGMSETEIAKYFDLSTTKLRIQKGLAEDERRQLLVDRAKSLKEDGLSLREIAAEMGFKNDSSVRSLLNENAEARMKEAKNTAEFLKKMVDEKGMIDVGKGVERELGISKEKLSEALYILEFEDGYMTYGGGLKQVTNAGKQTNLKVLCPPGTEHKEIFNPENIHSITEYASTDGGKTFQTFKYPESMDSKRLSIRYAEDGGSNMDGVLEIRRGVKDLDLGGSHYAQVRILVDGNKYLKGMAIYADDLPKGCDIRFNTNKTKDVAKLDVLKDIKNDPDNPFGALIKANGQSYYTDSKGNQKLSLINKTREEGDWGEWSKNLSSQFLGKQSTDLIKKQLGLSIANKKAEYDEIMSLTNPTVKKVLLKSFSDDCDSAAVQLKAASLPRQAFQVILPLKNIKDNEVYAPNYKHGETVALVRYPHGGTFEIPILKVNNRNVEGGQVLGKTPKDAIGINKKVAERLSGADFDGDTVMVIPCNSSNSKVKITGIGYGKQPLKDLEGFDPSMAYPYRPGMKVMSKGATQKQMGVITNLINDMQIKGAGDKEIARAVKHSMVVIDANKHKLDYRQSEKDNGIAELKKKYQGTLSPDGSYHEGASTLLSRASSEIRIPKSVGNPKINKETGEIEYERPIKTYVDKNGKTQIRSETAKKMAVAKDAYELVDKKGLYPVETLYADYANQLKSMGNAARKSMVSTGKVEYNATAKKTYEAEVKSLESQLNIALKNAPRERQAQLIANSVIKAKKLENPELTKAEIKKMSQQALTAAREQVGAQRTPVKISDNEWKAIQAGAISETKLFSILNNTDIDNVRALATPRSSNTLSAAQINRIKAYQNSGYPQSEIAEMMNISTSTVNKYLN